MATRSNLILRSVAHPSELNPFALANVAVFFFFLTLSPPAPEI